MGTNCHYCDGPAEVFDHVVPRRLRGSDRPHNLVRSCHKCNAAKGGKLPTCTCEFCQDAIATWIEEVGSERAFEVFDTEMGLARKRVRDARRRVQAEEAALTHLTPSYELAMDFMGAPKNLLQAVGQ